ncbi:hypothetical protein BC826DRAFT_1034257 [Russula brevipes]|nr:hypothetical protein BC826DRAFT_1034257 [Russula brevipes]
MRDFSIPSSTPTTMDPKLYQDPHHQDPRYQSDPHYQNPPSNPPPQPEEFTGVPHQPTTRDAHPNYQSQHAYQTHSESSQRSHAGHHSGYLDTSQADERLSFPEPHLQPPTLALSQPTQNTNPGFLYQQPGQYSYPSSGGPSGGHQVHTTSGSFTGGTTQYAQPTVQTDLGGRSTVTGAHPQDGNKQEYESLEKGPFTRKAVSGPPQIPSGICRYRGCHRPVFVDRRVNEPREWCSDSHMRAAIEQGMEKPCKHCQVWPRRYGFKCCSWNVCKYPGSQPGVRLIP